MDIGVTISKVRKEYKEYLRETHPDWADTTISTHVSDAFYLYQNTIALSFWKCFESDASMEKAKGEIFDYLKQEVMSDRADERTAQYYRDLKRLKEFIDSKGGVKTYIGYEYDCEVIVYKYAKMVYDGTMEMDAAVKAMCQEVPCFGETSHKLTIMLFASMMKGKTMAKLYEKFILGYYQREHPELKAYSPQIAWQVTDGYRTLLPTMQSDIVITNKAAKKTLIIDAKYYTHNMQMKAPYMTQTLHSGNLYQIFTYVKNWSAAPDEVVSGMLLYAGTDDAIQPNNDYQMSGNQISVKTLDMDCDFSKIAAQLDSIADRIK